MDIVVTVDSIYVITELGGANGLGSLLRIDHEGDGLEEIIYFDSSAYWHSTKW